MDNNYPLSHIGNKSITLIPQNYQVIILTHEDSCY